MSTQNQELTAIIKQFAECGWDVIDAPAKTWLDAKGDEEQKTATTKLVAAIKQADKDCGSCGCEMDPLYKEALKLIA